MGLVCDCDYDEEERKSEGMNEQKNRVLFLLFVKKGAGEECDVVCERERRYNFSVGFGILRMDETYEQQTLLLNAKFNQDTI